MRERIGLGLDFIDLPRMIDIGDYEWYDIELDGTQVGKSRCRSGSGRLTIYSIMIYPEYQRRGFARAVIDHLKSDYPLIIADRVRFTARDFWTRMGFAEDAEGLFVWRRPE
jgi:ribosomal protein S18 acetylase RimI-like enzyme